MTINRRQWLTMASAASLGAVASKGNGRAAQATKPQAKALDISEYQPRSMLHVKQTRVERARYPLIDIHTHLSMSAKSENGVSLAAQRRYLASPAVLMPVMDRRNIRALTNLTGGYGAGLAETVRRYEQANPGRFYTFTEPSYDRFL